MLSTLFYGLAHLSAIIFNLLTLLIIISVAMSWFNVNRYNRYALLIERITEWMYRPVRRLTSRLSSSIDFSPTIILLAIVFLQKTVPTYLMMLSFRFAH